MELNRFVSDWQLQAKCRTMPPEWFDLTDTTHPAPLLCAGCVVKRECAAWHLGPVNVSEYVERVAGWCPDDTDDVVLPSGVKAAGMDLR